MSRLSKEEKELYKKKKAVVYRRLQSNRFIHFDINYLINSSLHTLVKGNNLDYICDMYIDFIEEKVRNTSIMWSTDHQNRVNAYKYWLEHYDYVSTYDKVYKFCKFLVTEYRTDGWYYGFKFTNSEYYEKNWELEDNKAIYELREFVLGLIYYEPDDNYYIGYNIAILKLMAHIILHKELLYSQEDYQRLLLSLEDNYSVYYDDYINNGGDEIGDKNFFHPLIYIKKYIKNNKVKKEIL